MNGSTGSISAIPQAKEARPRPCSLPPSRLQFAFQPIVAITVTGFTIMPHANIRMHDPHREIVSRLQRGI